MAPEIRTIKTVDGYRLRVTFKNGEVRFFDMRRFLDKGIFQELKNHYQVTGLLLIGMRIHLDGSLHNGK